MVSLGRVGFALWFGLTIYLFQIASPRPLDWTIIGPIGGAILSYFVLFRSDRRRSSDTDDFDRAAPPEPPR